MVRGFPFLNLNNKLVVCPGFCADRGVTLVIHPSSVKQQPKVAMSLLASAASAHQANVLSFLFSQNGQLMICAVRPYTPTAQVVPQAASMVQVTPVAQVLQKQLSTLSPLVRPTPHFPMLGKGTLESTNCPRAFQSTKRSRDEFADSKSEATTPILTATPVAFPISIPVAPVCTKEQLKTFGLEDGYESETDVSISDGEEEENAESPAPIPQPPRKKPKHDRTKSGCLVRNAKRMKRAYCYCQTLVELPGEKWIKCCDNTCPNQWFHLDCAGLKRYPRGQWLCRDCQ